MPLQLDEGGSKLRRDFTPDELLATIRKHNLPRCLERTAIGDVPEPLRYWCEPVSPNHVWPLQPDFIPVWTTNGTECLAYEPSLRKYTSQHIEDVAVGQSRKFDSFRDVSIWVLLDLVGGESDDEIREAAAFLGFDQVEELLGCMSVEEFYAKHSVDP
ncbi:MAG TPA: hypothetical protein VL096_15480 [Pirellulaceae bacterium]|nr:hypothetical protein [Pirellulaceae bacterium]